MKETQMMEAQSNQNHHRNHPEPSHINQYQYEPSSPSPSPPIINNENQNMSNVTTRNEFIDMLEAALEPNKRRQRTVMQEWKKLSVSLHFYYTLNQYIYTKITQICCRK